MSRFVKPFTNTIDLGPCQCPGTPHSRDSAEVFNVLGWDDLVDVQARPGPGERALAIIARAIASWTLVDEDTEGKVAPVPLTEADIHRLDDATSDLLWPHAIAAYDAARKPLPNEPAAPSPSSTRESGSPPLRAVKAG